jgi:hypothetical protein
MAWLAQLSGSTTCAPAAMGILDFLPSGKLGQRLGGLAPDWLPIPLAVAA